MASSVLAALRFLPGETHLFRINPVQVMVDGLWLNGILTISTFRLFFQVEKSDEVFRVPMMLVESAKRKTLSPEQTQLKLKLKDFRIIRITLESKEAEKLNNYVAQLLNFESLGSLFAFDFNFRISKSLNGWYLYDPIAEYERMGVPSEDWRVTNVNSDYLLCASYPSRLCVPSGISGQELMIASKFRSGGRIPVLVWKNAKASISRCSQPMTGITGNRCIEDEKLVQQIVQSTLSKKVFIFDARPKANAMANSMKGGGYENTVYYENCVMGWGNLPNIHAINDAWQKMRNVMCQTQIDETKWYSMIESTLWYSNVNIILNGAMKIVEIIEKDTSVLIHCTDGWDRTPTLASLAQLLLDPYYRTIRGFIILIEKDWLSFGHRFAERCGVQEKTAKNTTTKASGKQPVGFSPVFMMFVECVYQLINQFPFYFEFNANFLLLLIDACYSCQYGTFLCNAEKERRERNLRIKTVSLWTFVNANVEPYKNSLFKETNMVLHPSASTRDFVFWEQLYLRHWTTKKIPKYQPKNYLDSVVQLVRQKDQRIQQLEEMLAEALKLRPITMTPVDDLAYSVLDDILDSIFTDYIYPKPRGLAANLKRQETGGLFGSSPDSARRRAEEEHDEQVLSTSPSSPKKVKFHSMNQTKAIPIRSRLNDSDHAVGSFRVTLPPKWVPDFCVDHCKGCDVEFTSFRRKHHCRHCGEVFCSNCCENRRKIEKFNYTSPQRVCDKCCQFLDSLKKGRV